MSFQACLLDDLDTLLKVAGIFGACAKIGKKNVAQIKLSTALRKRYKLHKMDRFFIAAQASSRNQKAFHHNRIENPFNPRRKNL